MYGNVMVCYVTGAHCDQVPESMNIAYGTDLCFNGERSMLMTWLS